jgi:hypothetical protein
LKHYAVLEALCWAAFSAFAAAEDALLSSLSAVCQIDMSFSASGLVSFTPSCDELVVALHCVFTKALATLAGLPRLRAADSCVMGFVTVGLELKPVVPKMMGFVIVAFGHFTETIEKVESGMIWSRWNDDIKHSNRSSIGGHISMSTMVAGRHLPSE